MNNRALYAAALVLCLGGAVGAEEGAPVDALERWDDNGDGRITCAEARRHGIAPVPCGHPAYPYMRDADNDGVVCERG